VKIICFFVNLLLISATASKAQTAPAPTNNSFKPVKDSSQYFSLRILPANYYATNIGFFCKKELQMQKTTKIPLKFRLGSIEYTNKLEGKNAIWH